MHIVLRPCLVGFVLLASTALAQAATVDFPAVQAELEAANPRLEARRQMEEAARRREGPAGVWPSPMLTLGVMNLPTSGQFDIDPMTMKMVELSQRVPIAGRNRLERRSAERAAAAEAAATRATRNALLGEALESYADAYYAATILRHTRDHQGELDRIVGSARSRYESGSGRLEEVLRAEAERARLGSELASIESEERGARARLAALRGLAADREADTLALPPVPATLPERQAWIAAIGSDHPRLAELDRRIEGYRLSARAARRSAWPDLELTGSYGAREKLVIEPLHGSSVPYGMYSATVGFAVPILPDQRGAGRAAEWEAMARSAEAERRAVELDLTTQVIAAAEEAAAARRSAGLLADTVLATERRALEAAWASYTAGSTDLRGVLEVTHSLHDETVGWLRARQALAHAEARLLSLTGRGDLLGIATATDEGSRR